MKVLISDANILIDFEEAGFTQIIFQIPDSSIVVPDMLFEDELRAQHEHLLDYGLICLELNGLSIQKLKRLNQREDLRRISFYDLSALVAAQQEDCPLLTGDRRLRALAKEMGVEVYGTLWLAERLVYAGLLSVAELRQGYARMKAQGRRLPWAKVEEQLKRLEGKARGA
ncbi:DUF3368 domain-containing protein [Myxococcota bacterium]|nr:DUF3368 domain-containing protein [Myxococcota bacterium]MBU1897762.1 DUF3368 domain-containing protein [Myxococcota bacterium]